MPWWVRHHDQPDDGSHIEVNEDSDATAAAGGMMKALIASQTSSRLAGASTRLVDKKDRHAAWIVGSPKNALDSPGGTSDGSEVPRWLKVAARAADTSGPG